MKKWLTIGGLVAACAACCAPLLMPVLAGAGLAGAAAAGAGWLAGLPIDAIVCGVLPLVALAGHAVWHHRRRRAGAAACECAAACDTSGCGPVPAGGHKA